LKKLNLQLHGSTVEVHLPEWTFDRKRI